MASNKSTPAIRFTGFTDDWEQRELRTAATFSKGSGYSKNDLKENGTPIILYGRLYTKYETVISEVDTFVDVQPNSVYSTGHEVIVPASGETAEDISRASFVAKSGILLGGDLNIIVPDDYINPVFLALTISNGNQQKELSKRAQGKSVVHIHNSDLENVVLLYPKYEEQEKIGEYFSKLDSLITLHQRKLEKLKHVKKSMLAKMFPKNGESIPEIRFAGFTSAWEQRKLGEVLSLLKDGTHGTHQNSDEGVYLLSAKNIKNGQIVIDEETDRKISVEEFEAIHSNFKLKENDVLLTIVGSIGETAILKNPDIATFQRSVAFLRPNEDTISIFLKTEIDTVIFQKELADRKSQSAQPGVYLGELEKIPFYLTSIPEQQKIGTFFSNLDTLITLHQRKLEKLENIKKTMLDKMFVN